MATFPKTLIIGLGGLGSDITVDVFQRFNNHSEHEDDKKNVRFLALDTDSNEISQRREIMNPEDVIQTSATTNVTAGHFLDEIKNSSTVEKWFPTESSELTQMSINDGAGQIRVVSRLAFSHAIHNRKLDRIGTAINELLRLSSKEGNNIEIHIVSSLAGGTGAGSFLQTAYFVREILQQNGITNPKVWGYFLLGDVFLNDPSINLADSTKSTNILANTYACIKELNGFYELNATDEIEFEYGRFSSEKTYITKNNSIPFDQCFLYDFENKDGKNLTSAATYKNQISEFLYLNAFSPTGNETRSRSINEIFGRMKQGSSARYGSTGISKIVYPLENLLQYFSVRRLSENLLSTWLKIDKDFEKLFEEWRIDTNKGIIKKEPILSEFFINNVATLASNGMGTEQAIFNNILLSTQVVDKDSLKVIGNKADYLLHEIVNYLTRLKESDQDINALKQISHTESFTGKENDEDEDRSNIKQVEDQVDALHREVFSFIDDNKRLALDEVFTKDINTSGYYIDNAKHRINSYLLEKNKALHPLAMRYFYYDLLHKLENNLAILRDSNIKNLAQISNYQSAYDVKNDKGEDTHIETALEAYEIYRSSDKTLLKRFAKLTGKSTELDDFKTDFVAKSKTQANVLQIYALEKLEEYVFEGLLVQIKKMIENLESLFNGIPAVLVSLNKEQSALVSMTNDSSGDPTVINILASQKHREYIYNEEIAKKDTIYFPEDISRSIYEELYSRTCQQVNNPLHKIYDKTEDRINKIFTELVVEKQKNQLQQGFKNDFAGYNIIQAMRRQAELDGIDNPLDFMRDKCREATLKATPFGAKYAPDSPKINSWAFHPECVEYSNLTKEDADALFNNVGNNQNNANRVVSDYFDRKEILREDTVMTLSVPIHYPKFASKSTENIYQTSHEGIYYTYYKKRIQEIQNNSKLPSPHLDKRWDNPRFFRDLGIDKSAYEKKVLKAFIYGLSSGNIILIDMHGTQTWGYFNDSGINYFTDDEGKTIKSSINKLISESLWNNEQLVNDLVKAFEKEIKDSQNTWEIIEMEGKSLLTIPLLKNIRSFKIDNVEAYKNKNLISLFNGKITNLATDSSYVKLIFQIIIETIITITGNNGENTKQQALSILGKMSEEIEKKDIPLTKDLINSFCDKQIKTSFE